MKLLAGDILLFERKNFNVISTLVRLTQGNKFIHCGIVVKAGDEHSALILEIDSDYTSRIVPFSKSTESHIPRIMRNADVYNVVNRDSIEDIASKYVGLEYNFKLITDLMIYHMAGRLRSLFGLPKKPFKHHLSVPLSSHFICSTLVSKVLSDIPNSNCQYLSYAEPDDFDNNPKWIEV